MCIRDRPSSHPSIHDQDIYSNFDYSGVLSQTAQSKFTTDHCDQVHPNDSFLDYLEFSENGGDKRIDEDTAYSIGLDDELYVFKQLPDSAFFDAKSSKKTTDREKIPQINAQSGMKRYLSVDPILLLYLIIIRSKTDTKCIAYFKYHQLSGKWNYQSTSHQESM
eukprot:TRINITY_DN3237_c0_g1_i7.p1 TRINITY_DN3237_c0_g1~~TRINITY_DN3237_c0_g1_i7.p1  ORF type:complete len:164 (+),score=10.55 TRINITY_DN3237_c0_g1_i7:85-576(+)